MASATTEKRALSMLKTFELAGRTVSRVTIDGRKIEFVCNRPVGTAIDQAASA